MALALAAVCAVVVASASAAPSVMRGWPRAAPAGPLMQGPQGGVVVAAQNGFVGTVAAYRRNGTRLWLSARTPSCGNCDDGPQSPALEANGTYGPIGPEGDDIWAVDARGRIVAGCAGVVLADSTCITGMSAIDPPAYQGWPAIAATTPGGPPWRIVDRATCGGTSSTSRR